MYMRNLRLTSGTGVWLEKNFFFTLFRQIPTIHFHLRFRTRLGSFEGRCSFFQTLQLLQKV